MLITRHHRRRRALRATVAATALIGAAIVAAPSASAEGGHGGHHRHCRHGHPGSGQVIASGIQGASGSTIGPDGALYVTESDTGSILRIDRRTGETSVFATGLPVRVAPIGGPMDIVFRKGAAYVLVSLVGEFFGTDDPSGIYRIGKNGDISVLADLGAWAVANPPGDDFEWGITTGVHYAIDTYRDGFVVTDAHHNKLLYVDHKGEIEELLALGNVVPAGLETRGSRVLMSFTGPVPHLPEDGQIVSYRPHRDVLKVVASGAPLMVDVERGRGRTLFGLSQGDFAPGGPVGAPAEPDTGELVKVKRNGDLKVVASGLDRPTSMEIVGCTAYVVGLGGDVVRLHHVR